MESSNSNRLRIKGFSLTWKVLRRNSIRPEDEIIEQILKGFKKESKTYVLNPKYSTPTSLPLYFYFGYQLFQESKCFEECGPVRNKFLVFLCVCVYVWSQVNSFNFLKTIAIGCCFFIFFYKWPLDKLNMIDFPQLWFRFSYLRHWRRIGVITWGYCCPKEWSLTWIICQNCTVRSVWWRVSYCV